MDLVSQNTFVCVEEANDSQIRNDKFYEIHYEEAGEEWDSDPLKLTDEKSIKQEVVEIKTETELMISEDELNDGNEATFISRQFINYDKLISSNYTDTSQINKDSFWNSTEAVYVRAKKSSSIEKIMDKIHKPKRKKAIKVLKKKPVNKSFDEQSDSNICYVCHKTFTLKANLSRHIKKHLGLSPKIKCEQCQYSFADKCDLKRHFQSIHLGIKRKRKYNNGCKKSDLHNIVKSSSNILAYKNRKPEVRKKNFICFVCEKSFYDKDGLSTHMVRHGLQNEVTGGRTIFKCDICQKAFSRKTEIVDHIKAHVGMKDFVCEICKRAFVNKSHLNRHERSNFHKNNVQNLHAQKLVLKDSL